MLGWLLGAVVALADGLVWSELAAAFPGSGGTYHFYDAVYGESWFGRLLKFLFVWQFLFSAPLELATGAIGFARYAGYLWKGLDRTLFGRSRSALGDDLEVRRLAIARHDRDRRDHGARLSPDRGGGQAHGRPLGGDDRRPSSGSSSRAWPDSTRINRPGGRPARRPLAKTRRRPGLAMYCFLGYYQICYLGDEVADPSRTIPRSILISVCWSRWSYFLTMNVSILGVIPGARCRSRTTSPAT